MSSVLQIESDAGDGTVKVDGGVSLLASRVAVSGGAPKGLADGLGFTSDQWQPGDIFLQRFAYEQAGDYLETGLYDYLSGK